MDSTPFCNGLLSDNRKTSRYLHVENATSLIITLNKNFRFWKNRQIEASTDQPRQEQQYRESRSRHGRWKIYNQEPFLSTNGTLSTSASKDANINNNNYAALRRTSPTNGTKDRKATRNVRAHRPEIGWVQKQ